MLLQSKTDRHTHRASLLAYQLPHFTLPHFGKALQKKRKERRTKQPSPFKGMTVLAVMLKKKNSLETPAMFPVATTSFSFLSFFFWSAHWQQGLPRAILRSTPHHTFFLSASFLTPWLDNLSRGNRTRPRVSKATKGIQLQRVSHLYLFH